MPSVTRKASTAARKPARKPVTAAEAHAAALGPADARKHTEYSVAELAKVTQTTIRNIRSYQDRGLIPPPERRGRNGVYSDAHVSRLRIIAQLLARGYTLSSIGELLEAWERGADFSGLFGLELAVSSPWTDEQSRLYTLTELLRMFGDHFDVRWLAKAAELKILVAEGQGFRAPSPRLIQAGAELVKAGIPLDQMLDVIAGLRANVERAAEQMVQLVEQHLFDPFGKGLPPPAEVPRLADIIWRLRPLVEMAVNAEVARAMEIAATRHLGDRLAAVLDHQIAHPKR
ncbi:MAG: MerR family transcriptional regulator [Pseudomonadota bacterium]|nr:MerR family transcriptional regulator [Pseudomonadota bacterium]